MDHSEIFTKIYDKRIWAKKYETPSSGTGSGVKYNSYYIDFINRLIQTKNITSILDLGCGDWTFTTKINLSNVEYLGVDCVEEVINNNIETHSTSNINFMTADFNDEVVLDELVIGKDLIILKDVLQHWSDDEIILFLDYMAKLESKPLILITHGKRKDSNKDKKRSVDNYYHYSNLNFKHHPLNRYNIQHLFDYQYKEVGIINL